MRSESGDRAVCGRVAVAGSFAVGLTLRSDRFPVPGETLLARDFDQGPGGKGSNQAVQAARMGAGVELLGVIGRDSFGDMALDLFATEGVGTTCLRTTSKRNTGLGFIMLDSAGENRILLDPGANDLFSAADVAASEQVIRESDVVIAQLEIPVEAAQAALASGRRAGALTILNPAPARALPAAIFPLIDLLIPNQTEARILSGLDPNDPADDVDVCARLLALGVATIVLTRGPGGVLVVAREGHSIVGAFPVQAIDSTGAGDAFSGTLAAVLARGGDREEGVTMAAAAGALACTTLGVIPSLPHRAKVEALVAGVRQ